MKKTQTNPRTIGIIGGGQLGRMSCFSAHQLGFRTVIFTDQKESPASFVTDKTIVADYSDQNALRQFAELVDIATFEFENIPLETAEFVASITPLHPKPQVLKIAQHRILEKNFINSIGIKTTEYAVSDFEKNLEKFVAASSGAILKTATMGYDGKGQYVLKAGDSMPQLGSKEWILEKFCQFDSEISVMVARSTTGEIKAYEPLTNIHKNGILDESHYPAKISDSLKIKAKTIAEKIALELDLVGILAVEMFVVDEDLLVNEIAPRPHNSGHFSMNGCVTSQFEQMIRAISGMPLGSTDFHSSGYMKNLIGNEVTDIEKFSQNPRAKIHLYGKEIIAEGRKMAHINFLK